MLVFRYLQVPEATLISLISCFPERPMFAFFYDEQQLGPSGFVKGKPLDLNYGHTIDM